MDKRFAILIAVALAAAPIAPRAPDWPPIDRQARPWTRWWWMGSAVTPAGLTTELESLRAAASRRRRDHTDLRRRRPRGRLRPISQRRVGPAAVAHAARGAAARSRRRHGDGHGMAVRRPVGGRRHGGAIALAPHVDAGRRPGADRPRHVRAAAAAANGRPARFYRDRADPGAPAAAAHRVERLLGRGAYVDLTSRVAPDGALAWDPPPGRWTLYGLFLGWHGKTVERAAPGGEGAVIDHFSRDAIRRYLDRFDRAFADGGASGVRAFFNDSYESLAVGASARLAHFGTATQPAEGTAFEAAALELRQRGFTYDYISDRQLAATRVSGGRLVTSGGGSYKALVVPASRFIPVETCETILALAQSGGSVIAYRGLPQDAAGLADLDARRARLDAARQALRGHASLGDDLEALLTGRRIAREPLVDRGLEFARRSLGEDTVYFIRNPADQDVTGWLPLATRARAAVIFDPMTGAKGAAETRTSSPGALDVKLSLPHGESVIVVTTSAPPRERYEYHEAADSLIEIPGPWRVRFVDGGPELPAEQIRETLTSWTTWGNEALRQFSGTAVYSATLPAPAQTAAGWQLDLGTVYDSARVRLNGRELGTLIGPRFRVTIERARLPAANTLGIEVSNLMANRIAAMDRAGVRWRIFYNVNFPARFPQNRGPDGLFSAASWEPLDSGLLGPVTLTPLR